MPFNAIFALFIVVLCLGLLIFTRYSQDVILLGGLTLLITFRVIDINTAVSGFANEGFLTVAILFIIAAGLRDTGAIDLISQKVFGKTRRIRIAQMRIMGPVIVLSAFLNNTPLVAALIPAVSDWAKKNRVPASKLMIPLSYAAILGGTITIIGTSTNLVVNGLISSTTSFRTVGFFEIAYIGIPASLIGFLYMLLFGNRLLPYKKSALENLANPKEYTVEMIVDNDGPLINKSIEDAGLRHLPGLFLIEVHRNGSILPAVSPDEKLYENDRLIFTGITESVVDLQRMKGLKPATDQIFKLDSPRSHRELIESVVSQSNPLIGKTIREGKFRTHYNAVIIAVARNGKRLNQKIGDIKLQAADTLLLEAHPSFVNLNRNSRDFLLIRKIDDSSPPKHEKAWLAWLILLLMIIAAGSGILSILNAAMIAAGIMIITQCVSAGNARRSIEIQIILVIAASLGIGKALETSGAANIIAENFLKLFGSNPILVLAGIYLMTSVLTEIITNNAAAILMFPIALATTTSLELNFIPFVIAIMMAASASFSTPIGYQTNLMVYGPGGYQFKDYLRIGIPLNIILWLFSITIIPLIWHLK